MNQTSKDIIKQNTVDIHGKGYLTVAGRVQLLHSDIGAGKTSIKTEVLQFDPVVVIKATVLTEKGEFTGTSAVDPKTAKMIEKGSPFEVAETSAVGRALGFANYGVIDSIATADEIQKVPTGITAIPAKKPIIQPENDPDQNGVNTYGDEEAEWDTRTPEEIEMAESVESSEKSNFEPIAVQVCSKCGEPATFRSGVSKKNGKPWSAYFCSSDNKSHTEWL